MWTSLKGLFPQSVSVTKRQTFDADAKLGTIPILASASNVIGVCKDSYVVYACGFDRKIRMILRIKMMLQKWRCRNERALATLLADGITSTNNPLISIYADADTFAKADADALWK